MNKLNKKYQNYTWQLVKTHQLINNSSHYFIKHLLEYRKRILQFFNK